MKETEKLKRGKWPLTCCHVVPFIMNLVILRTKRAVGFYAKSTHEWNPLTLTAQLYRAAGTV